MRTLGIDLASQPRATAICVIDWSGPAVVDHRMDVADDDLLALVAGAEKTGIDAPLGWPADFARALADPSAWPAPGASRARLERRATDFWVHEQTGKLPLSVSTDRIAYPAMRAAGLLAAIPDADRSGLTGPVCEVYPDPSIRRFGLWPPDVAPRASYKGTGREPVRAAIVARLPPWLGGVDTERCTAVDDLLDALVCALVARATALGLTTPPPAALADEAATEGWIHLPEPDALDRLPRP